MKATNQDIKIERETFQSSKAGLDQMYIELQKKLVEESIKKIVNFWISFFNRKYRILSFFNKEIFL
jgi:hypothetical protein